MNNTFPLLRSPTLLKEMLEANFDLFKNSKSIPEFFKNLSNYVHHIHTDPDLHFIVTQEIESQQEQAEQKFRESFEQVRKELNEKIIDLHQVVQVKKKISPEIAEKLQEYPTSAQIHSLEEACSRTKEIAAILSLMRKQGYEGEISKFSVNIFNSKVINCSLSRTLNSLLQEENEMLQKELKRSPWGCYTHLFTLYCADFRKFSEFREYSARKKSMLLDDIVCIEICGALQELSSLAKDSQDSSDRLDAAEYGISAKTVHTVLLQKLQQLVQNEITQQRTLKQQKQQQEKQQEKQKIYADSTEFIKIEYPKRQLIGEYDTNTGQVVRLQSRGQYLSVKKNKLRREDIIFLGELIKKGQGKIVNHGLLKEAMGREDLAENNHVLYRAKKRLQQYAAIECIKCKRGEGYYLDSETLMK